MFTYYILHEAQWREMCIGHSRLCVCLSLPRCIPTLLHGPRCNLGNGRGRPLVMHFWADVQSVHGCRCYDNIHVCMLMALYMANAYSAEREMSASACTCPMAGWTSALILSAGWFVGVLEVFSREMLVQVRHWRLNGGLVVCILQLLNYCIEYRNK